MQEFITLFNTVWQLVLVVFSLIVQLLGLLLQNALVIFWLAWALCGINWPRAWQVLRQGAWAPFTLLVVFIAVVWSQLEPALLDVGFMEIPNFWWQLGAVALIAGVTLACGWLQGVLGWTPATIEVNPPAETSGHDHHSPGHDAEAAHAH